MELKPSCQRDEMAGILNEEKNMMKRKLTRDIIAWAMTGVLSFSALTGCGAKTAVTTPAETSSEVETPAEEKIVITDHLGREVVLEKPAETIVSGYNISTSMMIAMGLEDKIVGIEVGAEDRPMYKLAAEEFLALPNVGSAKNFNLEQAISLSPDLVILPVRLKEQIETLQGMGIPAIGINPETPLQMTETLTMIGKATGTEKRAKELVDYIDGKMETLSKLTEGKEKPKVYIAGNSSFLTTASSKMYQSYQMEMAGGENVAKDIEENYWAEISYEQLITYNPDVIVIVSDAKYTKEDLLKDEKLASLNAVKNARIYQMPGNFEAWDSPLPASVLGTLWMTSRLHEDIYTQEQLNVDIKEFYQKFFDVEVVTNAIQ